MVQAWERQADPRWQELFPTVTGLQDEVCSWQVSPVVAIGVASQLSLARNLLVDSYFAYPYTLVAAETALHALESCLRGCLPAAQEESDTRGFGQLVSEGAGQRRSLLSSEESAVLQSTKDFRNLLAHDKIICYSDSALGFNPSEALMFVRAIHEAVTELYERGASNHSRHVHPAK